MCEKKKNSKSIRLTDEVLLIVEACPGEGFNQKFENLVLEFKKGEQKRKERVAYYDKIIEKQKKQLAEIAEQAQKLAEITRDMQRNVTCYQNRVYDMQSSVNKYIRDAKSCI